MKTLPSLAVLLGLSMAVAAGPARAAEEPPADTIERGAQMVLDGLRAFFSSIPQYEAPEVLPNGDIIIRRVNPKGGQPDKHDGDESEDKGLKL
ncbi:hypothetical protein [Nisaea denitrificans]|uniref:hypothetical protein n=1 Tax=Nisaea denitrificans TaxID=390877 RepID=UPI000419C063|nr:hypothetical protein [Nisaea denitrificans]